MISPLSATVVVLSLLSHASATGVDQQKHGLRLERRQAATTTHASSHSTTTRRNASSRHVTPTPSTTVAAAPSTPTGQAAGGSVPMWPLASLARIGTTTTPEATQPLPTTYAAGASPPVAGAPPLPASETATVTALNPANYPALDRVPPTTSSEVQQWLSQIDMSKVPTNQPNGLELCANATYNAAAIRDAGASGNCWWSCGGCTAPTDITICPTKNDWGVSFDDGPSPYTPRLLNMLNEQDVKATFFVVGSRVLSRPEMLQTEYMLGHQISIHTWSHHPLTILTNEQIVAELGWTRKVIKDVIGVSPNTFRPPYGDIDNRVRAIAQQMGLTPILWTSLADGRTFDTADWKIGAGTVTASQAVSTFESFLTEATTSLSTGFIVLAHDLYQQSVDLAMGYILPAALNAGQLSLKPISTCQGQPLAAAYVETSGNANSGSSSSSSSSSRSSTASTSTRSVGTPSPGNLAPSSTQSSSTNAASAISTSLGTIVAIAIVIYVTLP